MIKTLLFTFRISRFFGKKVSCKIARAHAPRPRRREKTSVSLSVNIDVTVFFSKRSRFNLKKNHVGFSPFSNHWALLRDFAPSRSAKTSAFNRDSIVAISKEQKVSPGTRRFNSISGFVKTTRSRHVDLRV